MSSFDLFGNPSDSQFVQKDSGHEAPSYREMIPPAAEAGSVEDDAPAPRQFFGLLTILGIVAVVLVVQCFHLQIQNGQANRALAEGNSVRIRTVQPDRGLIVDRNGETLAHNTRRLALVINPHTLPATKAEREEVYTLLREKAAIPSETIDFIEVSRQKSPEPLAIKTDLSKEESLLYTEQFAEVAGVDIQEVPIRQYVALPSLGQLVGYVGSVDQKDVEQGLALNQRVGKNGLEKQYNTQLTGKIGKQRAEVNARGELVRVLPGGTETEAKSGQTLKLSIDSRLQQIVADALRHEMERRTKKFGPLPKMGASAVAIDPTTGAVRAMVSLPDYDPQLFARGITNTQYQELLNDPANPLFNRALQGQFPPGSTIKPLVAAAGLETGVITPNTTFDTPEAIYVGNLRFPDSRRHGVTAVRKAIAESNNIFFYAVGGGWEEQNFKGLGVDRLNEQLRKFGLSRKTGIDLGGESAGVLGDDAWKRENFNERWYIGDTYHGSIGQGYTLATPLQMALSVAAIANNGTLWKPSLAWSFIDPDTQVEEEVPRTKIAENIFSPSTLQVVREGMRQTVESGSGRALNTLKVTSAGKTGTAQFGTEGRTHAWYTGFAPYENPELAFAVMIEAGGNSYYSSVPVVEEILRNYFNDPLQPGQKLNSEPRLDDPNFRGDL